MTTFSTQTTEYGCYPNAFYRVSLKAIIRNDKGEVLCVKEKGGDWGLPGGGFDHGEEIKEALRRELDEEVAIGDAEFRMTIVGCDSAYLPHKEAFLLWVVYEVTFDDFSDFRPGVDADEVAFIDPHTFKDGLDRGRQLMYKWCVDPTHDVVRW